MDEFEFDKATVPAKWVDQLKMMCEKIKAEPGASVLCTGNTDTVGSEQYNKQLGQKRADAVKAFMVKQGVDAKIIQTDSKGEMEPAGGEPPAKHDPDPGQRDPANRRVEVVATWSGSGGGGGAGGGGGGGGAKGGTGAKAKAKPKGGAGSQARTKTAAKAKPKPKPKPKAGAKRKR